MSSEETQENPAEEPAVEEQPSGSRFPEMDALQSEIERRIRDNQKFLEHFMDKDYTDEDEDDEGEDEDDFEEL